MGLQQLLLAARCVANMQCFIAFITYVLVFVTRVVLDELLLWVFVRESDTRTTKYLSHRLHLHQV